jgi:hypothetical protein
MNKKLYINHLKALNRFNNWEDKNHFINDPEKSLSIIGDLYQLIPAEKRQRVVDVSGIILMRKAISKLISSANVSSNEYVE